MEVMYRYCEPSDFDGVFQLLLQLWPDKLLTASVLKNVYELALNSNNQVYTCAVYSSQIIGFCSLTIKNNLWMQGNLGFVDELVVDEQYREKGIGSKL